MHIFFVKGVCRLVDALNVDPLMRKTYNFFFTSKSWKFKVDYLSSPLSYKLPIVCKMIRQSMRIFFVKRACTSVDALSVNAWMRKTYLLFFFFFFFFFFFSFYPVCPYKVLLRKFIMFIRFILQAGFWKFL